MKTSHPRDLLWRRCGSVALAALLLLSASCLGDDWLIRAVDDRPEPLLPPDITWRTPSDPASSNTRPRIQAFRAPSGCTSDIMLRADADADAGSDPALRASKGADDPQDARVEVVIGADNPFFDFRRPGDLGGVGYQRLYSEVQVLDTGAGSLSLHCHAATPAGLENDGVADGPTLFSPGLTWFQDLGDGLALQGFIAKTMHARLNAIDTAPRALNYGMIVQHPMPGLDAEAKPRLFVFVETLGRYRTEDGTGLQPVARWDVLPGLHFQAGDNWWLSGGVLLPLGTTRPDSGLWQVTCAWQF